jgi:polyhydroxyalkanoate synthesis repressor PhaR
MPSTRRTARPQAGAKPAASHLATVEKSAAMKDVKKSGAPAAEPVSLPSSRILKKYPNRRLYDTRASSYITLADVKAMVLAGERFEVRDAKTSEDLTRSILLQIILEEETGGVPLFSASMLSQLIRFYGHASQGMMGSFLEKNLQTFTDIQARLTEQSIGLANPAAAQSPELWAQFLNGQAPVMQGLMGSYLEQSRKVFAQMQEQVAKGTGGLFPVMPGLAPDTKPHTVPAKR